MDDVCTLAVTGIDPAPVILVALALLALGLVVALSAARSARRVATVIVASVFIAGVLVAPAQSASAADCSPVPLVTTADSAAVVEDAAPATVTGNVVSNDTAAPGRTITVVDAGTRLTGFGSVDFAVSGTFTYTLDNANAAVNALNTGDSLDDTFAYRVTDGRSTRTGSLTVTISGTTDNSGPVATADSASITEDAIPNTVTANVLTNDTDADGDTLAVTNGGTFTLQYGTLTINANGSSTYTLDNSNPAVNALNNGQSLTDTFTYTVSDGHGGTATSALTITIDGTTDAAHLVATPDTATIKEDALPNPISGNVLTNDADIDGHTLSVSNNGTYVLGHGVLVINANGSYAFTLDNSNPAVNALNNGQSLTDAFAYTVSDGHGNGTSSTLTITITGTTDNRAPVTTADTNSVKEDTAPNPVTGNVLVNDSDPDGDTLSVTNGGTFTLNYGTLQIDASGSYTYTLDNSNPAVNSLDDGQSVTDTFTYNVSDGHGATATSSLAVTINGTTDG